MHAKIQGHAFKPAACAQAFANGYMKHDGAYARLLLLAQAVVSAVALPLEILLMAFTLPVALFDSRHLRLSALCAYAHLVSIPLSLGLIFASNEKIEDSLSDKIDWLSRRFDRIMGPD